MTCPAIYMPCVPLYTRTAALLPALAYFYAFWRSLQLLRPGRWGAAPTNGICSEFTTSLSQLYRIHLQGKLQLHTAYRAQGAPTTDRMQCTDCVLEGVYSLHVTADTQNTVSSVESRVSINNDRM